MQETKAVSELLDCAAVARLLHCSRRNVARLHDSGRMPAPLRIGGLQRWRREDIDRWLANGAPVVRHVAAQPNRQGG